jgi:hypothetical protein
VPTAGALAAYPLGALFGIVLVKAEIVSWFRIQEMFRFGSFHMYGILGSGIAVAAAAPPPAALASFYRPRSARAFRRADAARHGQAKASVSCTGFAAVPSGLV